MKVKSFVGVAGTSSIEEVRGVAKLMRDSDLTLFSEGHTGMLGFQVSQKSMQYGPSEGNRRVPYRDQLPDLLEEEIVDIGMAVHYFTRTPEKLVPEVISVLRGDLNVGNLIGCLQINGVWPTAEQISEIRASNAGLDIILQVSPQVTTGLRPVQIADKIAKDYPEGIEYLILDPSRGRGLEFDMSNQFQTYLAIRSIGIKSEIIFAGGFNGENVRDKVLQLRRALADQSFSIDAEGGLRDKIGEGYGNDVLNMEKVEAYLRGASEAFKAPI